LRGINIEQSSTLASQLMQHQEITNQKLPSGDYLNAAVSAIKPRIAQIIIISVPVIAPVPWPVDFDKSRLANAQKVSVK
jgi:hypothetical protein